MLLKRLSWLLLLVSSFCFGTANVSGKFVNPDTTSFGQNGEAHLDLHNCGGNFPVVSGASIGSRNVYPLAVADGTWSGLVYRNDEISCAGATSTTWWTLSYWVNGRQMGPSRDFICSQASCAFDSMTPITVYPPPVPPAQPLTGAQSASCSFTAASIWTCATGFTGSSVIVDFYDNSGNQLVKGVGSGPTSVVASAGIVTGTFASPASGTMYVANVGNWTPSVTNPNYIISNPTADQSIAGGHTLSLGGNLNVAGAIAGAQKIESTAYADSGTGADIFAKANNVASGLSAPGEVVIPPGSYSSVTTTLACINGITFDLRGVTVNYSGSGTAIKCQNVENSGVFGPALINGPGTGGSTIGLLFGIGSSGTGVVTTYNTISDIQFTGFNTACKVEGSGSNNGTYTNTFRAVYCNNSNRGWDWFPTAANFANANTCIGCAALGNLSDGFRIDGANGNWCIGCRSELNGGYGFNFSGTRQTNSDTIQGGWSEANTLGDTNWGSVANVTQTQIISLLVNSTPNVVGTPGGLGNRIEFTFSAARFIDWYSGVFNYHVSSQNGTGFQWAWVNEESPSSGITTICGLNRNSANNGQFYCGTPEYPFTARSAIDANGNQVKGVTNLQSNTANPAGAGLVRAASIDSLGCWRNNAGSADICLSKSAGDIVQVPAPVNINNTTAITSNSFYTTGSVTPSGVGAQTCSDQTFTVSGLSTADRISSVVPPSTLGNVSLNGYASASNTVLLHFCNPSAITVTPPAGVYQFQAMH